MKETTSLLFLAAVACFHSTSCYPSNKQQVPGEDNNRLTFLYFPTPEERVQIIFNDTKSLLVAGLKPSTKTIFLLDGFTSFADTPMNQETKNTYSGRPDINVVIVDWSAYSGFGRPIENPEQGLELYMDVLLNEIPKAGRDLAEFIQFICAENEIDFKDVTIIGHSLGAHSASAAGRATISQYNKTVGRIIGLDPALQLSELDAPTRLRRGDAEVVEIYNTNREMAGDIYHAVGDVAIFVNGGDYQPCEPGQQSNTPGIMCHSHAYSYKLYNYLAANDTIKACPCSGAACICYGCEFQCDSDGISIGPHIPSDARGTYHVKTGLLDWAM